MNGSLKSLISLWLLGLPLVLPLVWLVWLYNDIVDQEEQVYAAWAQVESNYQRRSDLIPDLVQAVNRYLNHERGTLVEVTAERTAALDPLAAALKDLDAARKEAEAPAAEAKPEAEAVLERLAAAGGARAKPRPLLRPGGELPAAARGRPVPGAAGPARGHREPDQRRPDRVQPRGRAVQQRDPPVAGQPGGRSRPFPPQSLLPGGGGFCGGGRARSLISRAALGALILIGVGALGGLLSRLDRPDQAPTSSVVDRAALLAAAERDQIAAYHARLLEDYDIDYRVLTAPATGDIERLSHAQFGELRVGGASRSGRGLLLVIDPAGDRVRLEVAAALEGIYTDGFVAYLQHRQMVPFFEAGRVADGILATTELIFARAAEATAGRAFDPATADAFSLGGGASAAARLGRGHEPTPTPAGQAAPGATPAATVTAYLEAMRARNGRADLDLYSRATQSLLRSWTMTPAQMDQIARAYHDCTGRETRVGPGERRAVVRYRVEQRQCAPWFLVREAGAWRLDLASGQHAIRFNHRNEWRLAGPADDYDFAFQDWRFDRNGFPLASR